MAEEWKCRLAQERGGEGEGEVGVDMEGEVAEQDQGLGDLAARETAARCVQ